MARPLDPDVDHVYVFHRRWLAEVLEAGGSLLMPGAAVWDIEHLDELSSVFTDRPDLGSGTFLEKLHEQLAQASPDAVQLMAELHVVYFLVIWEGTISAAKKRSTLETILSWMPHPVAVPDDVAAAMTPGILHPGQWAMMRRDTQIAWLIWFARSWQDQSPRRRAELVDDPWELQSFVLGVRGEGPVDSARLALLHLAHPDTFEPIVSPSHKQFIVDRFSELAGDETDVDRQILAIRRSLTPTYGERFDWYADPLIHRWWTSNEKPWHTFLDWLKRFRALPGFESEERTYKLELAAKLGAARQLVLAGDDGWHDALVGAFRDRNNNLTDWRRQQSFLDWLADDPDASRAALMLLWSGSDTPTKRLRLFLDKLPPEVLGPTGKQLNFGTFLAMAEDPTALPPAKITSFRKAWRLTNWKTEPSGLHTADIYERILAFLDELVHDSAGWQTPLNDRLDAQGAVWMLLNYGAKPDEWSADAWESFLKWRDSVPATEDEEPPPPADTGEVSLVDYIADAAKELNLDREVLDEIVELLDDKGQVVLYGPPGTGKTYLALRLARAIAEDDDARVTVVQFHPATTYEDFFEGLRPTVTEAGQVMYRRTDGPLVAIASAAAANPNGRYVLVIDEINRANLPKVFGELLLLLEHRQQPVRTLYRPDEDFTLPKNLQIIGTMNTADRSVALIDAAMRRRFHFVPFFPHDGPMKDLLPRWLRDGGGRRGVAAFLTAVNKELLTLVGEHLLVGPSHFMKTDLSDRALERIWTYNVFPLIEEQLWGNREEIDRWRWPAVRQRFGHTLNAAESELPGGGDAGGESPAAD
jgi:5-methylcytosine-specific restriction protein B